MQVQPLRRQGDDMIIVVNILGLLGGLVALYFGGSWLIKGSLGIAHRFNVSKLVIGLTVVAFGTSAPELFVSLISVLSGKDAISIGNVLGSNIVNIALILGLSVLIIPVKVNRSLNRFDMPVLFIGYLLLFLFTLELSEIGEGGTFSFGVVTRVEGIILFAFILFYTIYLYSRARKDSLQSIDQVDMDVIDKAVPNGQPLSILILVTVGGAAVLTGGSELLIRTASWLASHVLSVSERFIGVTIVAFGTSIPELATNIVAIIKKESDVSIGNIIGSNIFNTLSVIGLVGIIKPISLVGANFQYDFMIMIGITIVLYLFMVIVKRLYRATGITLLLCYGAYFSFLLMTKTV